MAPANQPQLSFPGSEDGEAETATCRAAKPWWRKTNRTSGLQGLNFTEPPGADPHAGWCGRGEWATTPPMPIALASAPQLCFWRGRSSSVSVPFEQKGSPRLLTNSIRLRRILLASLAILLSTVTRTKRASRSQNGTPCRPNPPLSGCAGPPGRGREGPGPLDRLDRAGDERRLDCYLPQSRPAQGTPSVRIPVSSGWLERIRYSS